MKKQVLLILISFFFISATIHAQTTRWYSYARYLANETYVDSNMMNFWPDNVGLYGYTDGTTIGYNPSYFNSMGMALGPVLTQWNNISLYGSSMQVGSTDAYVVDSIRIRGTYRRNNAKTTPVDTLTLSFVYGNGTSATNMHEDTVTSIGSFDLMTFYGVDTIHSLCFAYDSVTNIAKSYPGVATPPYIQKIFLTNTDTAVYFNRVVALTTPLSVPAGYCAAVAMSFKSGDASYYPGDTIVYASGAYKYGDFASLVEYAGTSTTPEFPPYNALDSNAGYFTETTYYDSYFPEEYTPNWFWWNGIGGAGNNQYPDIDFHVKCATCISNDTISGTGHVCVGATTSLSYPTSGGTWSSSNTGIATVGSSGIVTGVAAGTVTISYLITGHDVTTVVTVNPALSAGIVNGVSTVCVGSFVSLSDTSGSGVWSSSNTGLATVGSSIGIVAGVSTGTVAISYTVTNSCGSAYAIHTMTVNALPSPGAITGTFSVCQGLTSDLTDATAGGVWSSTNTSVAFVGTAGVVTGIGAGTAIISYAVTNGCGTVAATQVVTVNTVIGAIGAITGTLSVCTASTTDLTDATAGGAWSSSSTLVATVGGSTGVVTGVVSGTANITYTVPGCGSPYVTAIVTVNASSSAGTISGLSTVCPGSTISLSDAVSGGVWSSSNTGLATVGSSTGIVSGVSFGTVTISYTVNGGCGTASATKTVNISAVASAGTITGSSSVCVGAYDTLGDVVTSGTWNSANGHGFVSGGGIVYGVSAGVDTISYTVIFTCTSTTTAIATIAITVNPMPDAGTISGKDSVCITDTIDLASTVAGGTWSAGNADALVSSSGSVLGVAAGVDDITYTVSNTCGTATAVMPVNIVHCDAGIAKAPIAGEVITLYPNPAQNDITISSTAQIRNVVICNMVGQQVFSSAYDANGVTINLSNIPSGIYFAKINGSDVRKFVKE